MSYCSRYGISHILIRADRYGPGLHKAAVLFEPFTTFLTEHLEGLDGADMVLPRAPAASVIYDDGSYTLIDVAALATEWGTQAASASVFESDS